MPNHSKLPPVLTDEAREARLISMALEAAEQQFVNGTASSQVITHFLKLGAVREQLEIEKLKAETELAKAKADAIKAAENTEKAYREAIAAFGSYTHHSAFDPSGSEEFVDDGYYDEDV